ncbi:hypothetical protein [Dickeya dadantii]|uniref:hypothetical protein n=1 Tax=Dickeya dadantii TaxID=204038 RepID=UPI001C0E276E|nr:hypothetical protein [Dickeya dadantii]QWT40001.1 hypothetical protein KNV89_16760 [Dickeya dadantii]
MDLHAIPIIALAIPLHSGILSLSFSSLPIKSGTPRHQSDQYIFFNSRLPDRHNDIGKRITSLFQQEKQGLEIPDAF